LFWETAAWTASFSRGNRLPAGSKIPSGASIKYPFKDLKINRPGHFFQKKKGFSLSGRVFWSGRLAAPEKKIPPDFPAGRLS
jgi:hypothetical protein